jgi:hypothetical protein
MSFYIGDSPFTELAEQLHFPALWTEGVTERGRSKMATSFEKVEASAVIRFLHLQGKSAREIHDQMTTVYQEGVPSYDSSQVEEVLSLWTDKP